jgi:VWFA-related protein
MSSKALRSHGAGLARNSRDEAAVDGASAGPRRLLALSVLVFLCFALVLAGRAQDQPAAPSEPQSPNAQPQPAQPEVPAAGGPQGEVGPYSVPKKKEEPPPEPARPLKNPPEIGNFSISKDVSLVTVPVSVLTANGQFIPNLKQANFKVFEDGVEQKISSFNKSEAPITAVLLVEFADIYYPFLVDALNGAYAFAQSLKKEDWVAVIDYDMKSHILTDFTQDKGQILAALNQMRIPGFHERNLFDALNDTIGRLERVEGRKYIIVIATGVDTFSKLTFDKILKRVQGTKDICIYTVSTGGAYRIYMEGRGGLRGSMRDLDFLQADNEMRTFAKLTGGEWYAPRFTSEFPEIFQAMGANIRNQYVLAYHPANAKLDGTYRKLKIEVINAETGGPLQVKDQKNKNVKYSVIARDGYTAKHEVE